MTVKRSSSKLATGLLLAVAGIGMIAFGVSIMNLSNIFISYYSTNPQLVNNTNFSSNIVILTEVKKQTFEKINSDGLAVIGMGFGLFIGAIPFFTSWQEDKDRIDRAKQAINEDFKNINNNSVIAIERQRNVLKDDVVDTISQDLILGKMNRLEIISEYYRLLYFPLWNAVIMDLKDIDFEQQKIIQKLHLFITRANDTLENRAVQTSRSIEDVLSSNKSTGIKKTKIKSILQDGLRLSSYEYQRVYSKLREEIKNVEWIIVSDWQNVGRENTHTTILGTPTHGKV